MLYAILCYHDEAEVNSWPKEKDDAVLAKRAVVTQKLAAQGKHPIVFGADSVFSPSDFNPEGAYASSFAPDIHGLPADASLVKAYRAKYGDSAPQGPSPSGRELFTLAAAKHGLAPRDLPPSISFFKGVRIEPDGSLAWAGGVAVPLNTRYRGVEAMDVIQRTSAVGVLIQNNFLGYDYQEMRLLTSVGGQSSMYKPGLSKTFLVFSSSGSCFYQ